MWIFVNFNKFYVLLIFVCHVRNNVLFTVFFFFCCLLSIVFMSNELCFYAWWALHVVICDLTMTVTTLWRHSLSWYHSFLLISVCVIFHCFTLGSTHMFCYKYYINVIYVYRTVYSFMCIHVFCMFIQYTVLYDDYILLCVYRGFISVSFY